MENQHRKISGYRELSQAEIDLMNDVKALGPQIEAVVAKVQAHIMKQINTVSNAAEVERISDASPQRWVAIATTDFQTGLMALTRAIAQPTFF